VAPPHPDAPADRLYLPGRCGSSSDCAPNEVCQALSGYCFTEPTYFPGYCAPRPASCDPPQGPPYGDCGCDGRWYCSGCARVKAGVSQANPGRCGGPINPCVP
jgi:hypothetical protein